MTETEVLALAKEAMRCGRVTHSVRHLDEQSDKRSVSARDMKRCIETSKSAKLQPNGSWRIHGKDCDGDDLTVAVFIQAESIRIVTVF